MSILFHLLVLVGFGLMIGAHLPNSRLTELPAWCFWGVAALIWALPALMGV